MVLKDILALTKLNYNTCIFGDGMPITLKFADAVGEILTAGPIKERSSVAFRPLHLITQHARLSNPREFQTDTALRLQLRFRCLPQLLVPF